MTRPTNEKRERELLHIAEGSWKQWLPIFVLLIGGLAFVTVTGASSTGFVSEAQLPTADDFNWLPYVIMLLVSGAGVLILALWRLLKGNGGRSSRK